MILVDANILLYAEDSRGPYHARARTWWDEQLSGASPVCLCWETISAFIRIGTNPRIFKQPMSTAEAVGRVQSWLRQPCIRIIRPTENHWDLFQRLLIDTKAVAGLVPDAHLAALALGHDCELCSTDSDFARFPGLKWRNPLA